MKKRKTAVVLTTEGKKKFKDIVRWVKLPDEGYVVQSFVMRRICLPTRCSCGSLRPKSRQSRVP